MQIRIVGTKEEMKGIRSYVEKTVGGKVVSMSRLYPNRRSSNQYRLYIEAEQETADFRKAAEG